MYLYMISAVSLIISIFQYQTTQSPNHTTKLLLTNLQFVASRWRNQQHKHVHHVCHRKLRLAHA